ncbi:MAG: protein translocase subunit SecF [Desulfobacteraceae bacterium]|nr:MAG: protein translocase subunit SecF [Desulfobacteraceae bacterium]
MFQLMKPDTKIDFVGKKMFFIGLSLIAIIVSVVALFARGGLNLGVDFSGGIVIRAQLDQKQKPEDIRQALKPIQLEDSIIQEVQGDKNEYLIRVVKPKVDLSNLDEKTRKNLTAKFGEAVKLNDLDKLDEKTREVLVSQYLNALDGKVQQALIAQFGQGVDITQVEMVGPTVGKELREKALFALLFSLLFMSIYISWRFEFKLVVSAVMAIALILVVLFARGSNLSVVWLNIIALLVSLLLMWALRLKYALGAIIALIHDVIITVGAFAITNREVSLTVVAALLTIVGYSLNDTIVIFDRIRENARKGTHKNFGDLINLSVNQTLSRTILTNLTVFAVVIVLFGWGGDVINDFAFAMLIGSIVGTYSTIYIASPIILIWEGRLLNKNNKVKA